MLGSQGITITLDCDYDTVRVPLTAGALLLRWLARVTSLFLRGLNPFGAPKPLPVLSPSHFVPKKGFQL